MIYSNILELIGHTPIIKLDFGRDIADIYVKLEKFNIGGSVKDRAALGMIEEAEKSGKLKKGSTIVEPSSGNTGISLGLVGRAKGYNVIIVMPETMTQERKDTLRAIGVDLRLTPGDEGMTGAINEAIRLVDENENYFLPQQFENYANPNKHYESTGDEILEDIPDLDVFVTAVGSSGTLTGVAKKLKEKNSKIKIYAIEPETSAVLSGDTPGKHSIAGIGTGFIPKNFDRSLVDGILKVSDEEAREFALRVTRDFGLFLGISSGANIAVAYRVAKELGKGKKVVTISPDGGEKYLSVAPYKFEEE
jgi:cysteine synthase A